MTDVPAEYIRRIETLTPCERVARATAMFAWARGLIARQIVAEFGTLSAEELKWRVALRQYGAGPRIRAWVEQQLAAIPQSRRSRTDVST